MTKAELIADLKKQDQQVQDWLYIWLNVTHKKEPLLTRYVRGYIDAKEDEMNGNIDPRWPDYMDEIATCLEHLLK